MTKNEAVNILQDYWDRTICVDKVLEKRAKEAIEWLDIPGVTLADAFAYGTKPDIESDEQIDVRMTYDDLKRIIDLTNEVVKSQKWHYVEKDGNPKDVGAHKCVVIKNGVARLDNSIFFGHWFIEADGDRVVYAWMDRFIVDKDRIKLSDGVRWEEEV